MKNNTMGIVFASDNESHLNDLTLLRTTASLPFAGRYRLIDFVLSNMVEANITNIGIITRSNYSSLMDHIRMGRDWNLNRKNSGIVVFPPYVLNDTNELYKGKVEALFSLRHFMEKSPEDYVVISNSNIAFNIDFEEIEKFHLENNADITILTRKAVDLCQRDYVIECDENNRVADMHYPIPSMEKEEKDANLSIYLVKKTLLISLIDFAYSHGDLNFEKDVLQKNIQHLKIMAYKVEGYIAVVDKISAYFKKSMELLDLEKRNDLFYKNATILTKVKDSVPTRYNEGAKVKNSMIADGCVIDGEVENSILFRSVKVQKGAVVKNSIIMENGTVMSNAKLNYVISDKNVKFQPEREISGYESYPIVIAKNKIV